MSKIQHIAERLVQINDAKFQELCDCFLALRHPIYKAFIRSGSQDVKQKTIKGTPDSFFLLSNGNYIFVEATTKEKDVFEKLKKDVAKCLDEKKTGIPTERIQEVILCFNSRLTSKEVEVLNAYVRESGIYRLSLFNLDRLAAEISLYHSNLAKDYLDLPLDTGQIVSVQKFIDQYNFGGQNIATPLNNQFFHRNNELQEFCEALNNNDILILSGPPGVGKTKLAVEGISGFLKTNLKFNAFALANKDADLIEDLSQYFYGESKNILFVDDVNRIDKFSQIIGFHKGLTQNSLKLVLTVRDYALAQFLEDLLGLSYFKIELSDFTDEELVEIVKGEPFKIHDWRCHNEILRIADGNPRLAIMTTQLALKEQNLNALRDVSDLFDEYFGTFIRDEDAFKQTSVLEVLGILAFFYTIPYNDELVMGRLLKTFNIQREKFVEALDKLEKLELIELQNEHAKISEQNLSTYFFYKVFLKEKLLSFDLLLTNFFDSHPYRFKDTVIPVNNTFGYKNVKEKLEWYLKQYWNNIKGNESKGLKYLDHFWFYLQDEVLEFVFEKVDSLKAPAKPVYITTYGTNDFTHNQNEYIELVGNFFRHTTNLREALELGFEYARKMPIHFPELIKKINDIFSFDFEDEESGFQRQKVLIQVLMSGLSEGDKLYASAFFAVVPNLLKFEFQQFKSLRGGKLSLYRYSLRLSDEIEKLRKVIWEKLEEEFERYPEEVVTVMVKHSGVTPDLVKDIFIYDLKFIIPLVKNKLSNKSFKHCYYVQELIQWSKKNEITHTEFPFLKRKFINQSYKWFSIIDWNRRRGKEDYEFEKWEEFVALKEKDIRETFIFSSVIDFRKFVKVFVEIKNWKEIHHNSLDDSLDLIIDENIKADGNLGFTILKDYFEDDTLSHVKKTTFSFETGLRAESIIPFSK